CRREDQLALVPAVDEGSLACGNAGPAAEPTLNRSVAPHVIRVAVGVDEVLEPAVTEGVLEQGDGLLGVRAVAGVDDRGSLRSQYDAIRRKPSALEDLDSAWQLQDAPRAPSCANTARFSSGLIADHAAISASVRRQPSHSPVSGFILHTLMQGEATSSTRVAAVTDSAWPRAPARRATRARAPARGR